MSNDYKRDITTTSGELPGNAEHLRFWCYVCDNHVVDSHDSDTGKFFTHFGHVLKYDRSTRTRRMMDLGEGDDYPMITWAICFECMSEGWRC